MIVQSYRPSFNVLVLSSNLDAGFDLVESLSASGYSAREVSVHADLTEVIQANPPHTVIFPYGDVSFSKDRAAALELIEWLIRVLPEVHIICLSRPRDYQDVCEFYNNGLYDCIRWPLESELDLVRAVDRSIENHLHMYIAEQKQSEVGVALPVATTEDSSLLALLEVWHQAHKNIQTEDLCLDHLLKEISESTGVAEVLYLKFIPETSVLVVDRGYGFRAQDLADVGIDLRTTEADFSRQDLADPSALMGIKEFAREGLRKASYKAFPLRVETQVSGVVLLLQSENEIILNCPEGYLRLCIEMASQRLTQLRLAKQLKDNSIKDGTSYAVKRDYFMDKLHDEVTRSQRISRPVSLLILHIDTFHDFALIHESFDTQRLLMALSSLILKHSRPTDILGRLSENQFGLILAHTDRKGAAIKAERLRRIVERADFSRVSAEDAKISLSIGVSEYPGVCESASDLLRSADEALTEVIRHDKNKVCMAKEMLGFKPDFLPQSEL